MPPRGESAPSQRAHKQSGTITNMMKLPQESCDSLTVLFDGSCPLCRREVGVYRSLKPLNDGPPLQWLDVSQPQAKLPEGGERATYLARFHVQSADGTMLSGAAAFVALWLTLPGWRWLGRIGSLPGATMLVWQLTFIPLAAVFFHAGEFLLLLVAWRDFQSGAVTNELA